ncbi:MAG: hypothetical protein WAS07_03400 [Micropruina sp.]
MDPDLCVLLDPEILVAAPDQRTNLRFWVRMADWSADPHPRVGAKTMAALHELIAAPPVVQGLPAGDFWKIVGAFVSRKAPVAVIARPVCAEHLKSSYSPLLGDSANSERLLSDLADIDTSFAVSVDGPKECWVVQQDDAHCALCCGTCSACHAQRVHVSAGPSADHADIWRNEFRRSRLGISQLPQFADRLFPKLNFAESAWAGLADIGGDPAALCDVLMHHLATLNDHARRIWAEESTTTMRERAMGSLGVTSSPDSPNTHRNAAAMRARTIAFDDELVVCEWHTKIFPTSGRIYFAVENGRTYIGAITSHL